MCTRKFSLNSLKHLVTALFVGQCLHRPGARTFSSLRTFPARYSLTERAADGQGAKRRLRGWLSGCHHSALSSQHINARAVLVIAMKRAPSQVPRAYHAGSGVTTTGLDAASGHAQHMHLLEALSLSASNPFKFRRNLLRSVFAQLPHQGPGAPRALHKSLIRCDTADPGVPAPGPNNPTPPQLQNLLSEPTSSTGTPPTREAAICGCVPRSLIVPLTLSTATESSWT